MSIITITESARQQLDLLLKSKEAGPEEGLCLGVSKGGCAGWQYEMQVASVSEGDVLIDEGGVRVIVRADSIDKLAGCEVDYSDDLTDAGFKVNNPKARRACGCGTSFEPLDEPEGSGAEDGEVCGGGAA